MTDLTSTEMLERIKRGLTENSARFGPKIIVYEGMNGWGALRGQLLPHWTGSAGGPRVTTGTRRKGKPSRPPMRSCAPRCGPRPV